VKHVDTVVMLPHKSKLGLMNEDEQQRHVRVIDTTQHNMLYESEDKVWSRESANGNQSLGKLRQRSVKMHRRHHVGGKQNQGIETGESPGNGRDPHRVHASGNDQQYFNNRREAPLPMIPHARLYQNSPAPTPLGELVEVEENPDTVKREETRAGRLQRY